MISKHNTFIQQKRNAIRKNVLLLNSRLLTFSMNGLHVFNSRCRVSSKMSGSSSTRTIESNATRTHRPSRSWPFGPPSDRCRCDWRNSHIADRIPRRTPWVRRGTPWCTACRQRRSAPAASPRCAPPRPRGSLRRATFSFAENPRTRNVCETWRGICLLRKPATAEVNRPGESDRSRQVREMTRPISGREPRIFESDLLEFKVGL